MVEQLITYVSTLGWSDIAAVLAIISIVFEITPIKFNPISWIAKKLGDQFNSSIDKKIDVFRKEMLGEIDKLKKEQNEQNANLQKQIDEVVKSQKSIEQSQKNQTKKMNDNEIRRLRYEIISFSTSITNGQKFPIDAYDHIMDSYSEYHALIEENHQINGRIDKEFEIISSHYEAGRESGQMYF